MPSPVRETSLMIVTVVRFSLVEQIFSRLTKILLILFF